MLEPSDRFFDSRGKGGSSNAVLVRGVNWIGDAVMTIPALRAVRRSFPDAPLSLLVKPWVSPLFATDPDVQELLSYSADYSGFGGHLRLVRMLHVRRFCLAVLFQNAFDAALIAFLARIPRRIGYRRDGRGALLTDPVNVDARIQQLHHIDYYLELLKRSGMSAEREMPWLFLSTDERLSARHTLAGLRRPIIGINPGATYGSSKRWIPERFADVTLRAVYELNGSVVLFGGPNESAIADEIVRSAVLRSGDQVAANFNGNSPALPLLDGQLVNLAGRTDLRALMALIAECDVLLTNDSGPMHIGYAVGTPVVAIFGSTSPRMTGPAGPKDIVIGSDLSCSPCFQRECPKRDTKCMELIPAGDVFAAVGRQVAARKAVFFDRDGTLCRDAHYLSTMDDFEKVSDLDELKKLKAAGYLLIGVSNQSGIARGLVQEGFVLQINRIFMDQYGFDDFYYCPHHPDRHCSCRKPEPGMLIRARNDHGIDLRRSFVIGDKASDMVLARNVGATGILIGTGCSSAGVCGEVAVAGIRDAVTFILSQDKRRND